MGRDASSFIVSSKAGSKNETLMACLHLAQIDRGRLFFIWLIGVYRSGFPKKNQNLSKNGPKFHLIYHFFGLGGLYTYFFVYLHAQTQNEKCLGIYCNCKSFHNILMYPYE